MKKPKPRKQRADFLGPRRQISIRVQEDVAAKLKWLAAEEGRTLTWFVTHELIRIAEEREETG